MRYNLCELTLPPSKNKITSLLYYVSNILMFYLKIKSIKDARKHLKT